MRTSLRLATLTVAVALVGPGCRSLGTGRGTGAVIGSAVGAGAGYAIGDHNDDKWAGTAIGALAGGVAGWLIGDAVEPETHEVPIDGPAVYKTDRTRSPRLPDDGYAYEPERRTRAVRTTERVIVRDIYPDGTVRERTIPID